MKKVFAILLGCIAVSTAFAQFRFGFRSDLYTFMFNAVLPTGLYSQNTVPGWDGDPVSNPGVPVNILPRSLLFPMGPGNTTGLYVPSGYSFFTSSVNNDHTLSSIFTDSSHGFTWMDLNYAKLYVSYSRNRIEAAFGLSASNLFRRLNNRDHPTGNGILDAFHVEDWWMRLNHEMITLWIADRVFTGPVDMYNDFSEWSRLRLDELGVSIPGDRNLGFGSIWISRMRGNSLSNDVIDHNNLSIVITRSYFVTSIKLLQHFYQIPIALDVGIDISEHLKRINGTANGTGQARFAGGVRVTGRRIADHVDFELSWKLRGGDPTRDNSWTEEFPVGGVQPDGEGALSHVLGLAIGLPVLVPELGITLGYTALFTSYEDHLFGPHSTPVVIDPYTVTTTGPIFNGIDLRLRYTGIPRFRFTLHSNVSFANVAEPVWSDDYNAIIGQSVNLLGDGNLDQYRSQSWLTFNNALVVRYPVNNMLTTRFEASHRVGITTDNNSDQTRGLGQLDWGSRKTVMTMMSVSAIASIRFSEGVLLETGASLWHENNSTRFSNYLDGIPNDHVTTSWSAGGIGIGIPIRIRFDW